MVPELGNSYKKGVKLKVFYTWKNHTSSHNQKYFLIV